MSPELLTIENVYLCLVWNFINTFSGDKVNLRLSSYKFGKLQKQQIIEAKISKKISTINFTLDKTNILVKSFEKDMTLGLEVEVNENFSVYSDSITLSYD